MMAADRPGWEDQQKQKPSALSREEVHQFDLAHQQLYGSGASAGLFGAFT